MTDLAPLPRDQLAHTSGGTVRSAAAELVNSRPAGDGDDSGTDTDDEGRLIQQAAATAKKRASEPPSSQPAPAQVAARPSPVPPPPRPAAAAAEVPSRAPHASAPPPPRPVVPRPPPAVTAKGKAAPKRPAGAVTVRTLLDAGFLVPGCKVLYVEYKGLITWADLTEEGTIVCDGTAFESPSAFSIFVKRKLNPERKADDGWKAVKYAGKLLEHFKGQYLRQQLAASGLGGGATPSGSLGPSGALGPSPHSSVHQSPQRYPDGDGPPTKRQRTDADGEGAGHNGLARPGLKIKLKLKDGPGAPGGATPAAGRPPAPVVRTGPMMPLPAPAVAVVPCGEYSGAAGSGQAGPQPFRLEVSDMVVIVMDFHAHCCGAEVGGLLGGSFDEASGALTVSRAFPVLEVPQRPATTASGYAWGRGGGRPAVAVEFDATDLARVREVIRNWGLQVVGSYRSHPAYPAQPNALDVGFAARAQREARTPGGAEPYVCAILAPYDPASPDPVSSAITWFHVEYDMSKPLTPQPAADGGGGAAAAPPGCRPMVLAVETVEAPTAHMDIMNLVSTQFQHTARTYAVRPTRGPLALPWPPAGSLQPPLGPTRPHQTCLDKLVGSVASRLPDMFEGDLRVRYGSMVRDMVRHEFSLAERMGSSQRARAGSEDGAGGSEGGGWGSLALERSRRPARLNEAVAAARFDSDEEETEDDDDEVQLDDDDEVPDDDEL